MGSATFLQPSFLGGEWSPEYQGRIDDQHYKIAMNVSVNGFPTTQGAWKKRSGTRRVGATFGGATARLYPFNFGEDFPFETEWTPGKLRIWAGDTPVLDSTANLLSISPSSPATITVDAGGASWSNGDLVILIPTGSFGNAFGSLPAQQFVLNATGVAQQFTLTDPQTGANIDGSQIDFTGGNPTATIGHILTFNTPYINNDWYDVFPVMYDNMMFVFHNSYFPYMLEATNLVGADPKVSSFTFTVAPFVDGPYFDPVSGQTATVSGTSGDITVTFTNGFGPNQSTPVPGDVGRLIRLWNTPDPWDAGTQYTGSSYVYYNDLPYGATVAAPTIGIPPDGNPSQWAPNPSAALWVWASILSVVNTTQVTVQLASNLAYNNQITSWQLGVIGDPLHGSPNCGSAHEGRLWMFRQNEVYASQSAPIDGQDSSTTSPSLLWSPTTGDGTVVDSAGITEKLQVGDEDANNIQWAVSSATGLIAGTGAGEFVIKASQLDDPITPTTIQARRVTRYRVYVARPVVAPLAVIFVQKYQRKMMELLVDVFTGRYVAPDLTQAANHVSLNGLEEIVYQEELSPVVWARDMLGNLSGCTYRRTSAFTTEAPAFVGWHRHIHGQAVEDGRNFISLCMSPNPTGGVIDSLYVVTQQPGTTTTAQIERMVKSSELNDTLYSAWFLDNAGTATAMFDQGTGVKLYGFYDKAGLSVSAYLGGLYLGEYTVDAQGAIVVPYTSTFTSTYIQSIGNQNFGEAGTKARFAVSTTPARSTSPQTMGNFSGSMTPASGSFGVGEMAQSYGTNTIFTIAGKDNVGNDTYNVSSYNASSRGLITSVAGDSLGFGNTSGALKPYGCFVADPSGNLLIALDGTHQGELKKVDPSTMTVISTFGTYSASISQDFAIAAPLFNGVATVGCVAGEYLVTTGGIQTLTCNLDVIDTGNMQWSQNNGPAVAWNSSFCRGLSGEVGTVIIAEPSGSNINLRVLSIAPSAGAVFYAYIAGLPTYAGGTTYAIGDQVKYGGFGWQSTINSNTGQTPGTNGDWEYIPNPYITLNTNGQITPAQVDPTWTTMNTAVMDLGFDQTDGNAILWVSTTDVVTYQSRLIKVNTANAAVLWSIPVGGLVGGLANSDINNGQLGWAGTDGVLYSINTLAGTVTTSFSPSGTGINSASFQSYDTLNGTLLALYNYNSGTSGAPTPLSGTPSTFNEVGIYTPGTSLAPNTFTITDYTFPAVVGFKFTAQGQLLRPLLPGAGESGAQMGPALAKKRRIATYGLLVSNSQAFTIGTDFTHQFDVPLTDAANNLIPITQLYSGVIRNTLSDDSSFDGMIAWQSTDPYPLTIAAVEGFIETSDA